MNKTNRMFRFIAGLILVAIVGAACQSSTDSKSDDKPASKASDQAGKPDYEKAYSEVRVAYAHMYGTGDVLAGAIAKQKGFAEEKNAAADTRVALSRLLGEHVLLAVVATTKGLGGAPDFGASAEALDANSAELGDVIGSVYGDEAKNEFLKQWRDHIRMFVDYTKATAAKDKAGQDKAVQELGGYINNFGKFLADAVGLPASAVQGSVKEHVFQLKGALDAAAAGNFDEAYAKTREGYKHMVMTGGVLAEAISKQKNLGNSKTKQAETRIALGSLLAEHAAVAAVTTTKGLDGAGDFKAIAGALDANSVELGDVIGSVYGDPAKNEFLKQWRDHIRMFVDYTTATAKKDTAGQEKAVQELGGYITNFGQFLATAVGLPPAAVQEAVKMHVFQLKGALDAYAGSPSDDETDH